MIEIRIYYECLEQAQHYIKPIVQSSLTAKHLTVEIKLVKTINSSSSKYFSKEKEVLKGIYSLANPDILITGVADNKEMPIAIVEFTEAVRTEDHELQRSYGVVSAMLAKCFYIKIAGDKKSKGEFGKADYDPYSACRAFLDEFNYKGFLIAEWQTEKDNPQQLCHLPNYLSCPTEIELVTDTLTNALSAFIEKQDKWFEMAVQDLEKTASYKAFLEKLKESPALVDTLVEWKAREDRTSNKNKVRYFVRHKWVGAKINRFSHAMDPDRGILTFISTLCSNEKKVFGVYALVRPKSGAELKPSLKTLDDLKNHLKVALEKDKTIKWFCEEILKCSSQAKGMNDVFDIHHIFEKYLDKIKANKVLLTIAYFLDGMYLNHDGVKLTWDKYKLLGVQKGNLLDGLNTTFGFGEISSPLRISEISEDICEDDVTYTIVHSVLIPSGFQIVSVSYPGAQGGMAILPERDKGKSQKRKYLDVIALPPKASADVDVLLNENKADFSRGTVEKDVEKLKQYKADRIHRDALKHSLIEANVMNKDGTLRKIIIGVGFGASSDKSVSWCPRDVDFIFRLESRERWSIGIFHQELSDLIKKIQGNTNFPQCYKVVERRQKTKNEQNNFEFEK